MSEDQDARECPEFNGILFQPYGGGGVFLVLNGKLRLIPDYGTLDALFIDNPKIERADLSRYAYGPAISSGAVLARAFGTLGVYLVTNGQKMLIPSNEIRNLYQFSKNTYQDVPPIILDSVPSGPAVEGRP